MNVFKSPATLALAAVEMSYDPALPDMDNELSALALLIESARNHKATPARFYAAAARGVPAAVGVMVSQGLARDESTSAAESLLGT